MAEPKQDGKLYPFMLPLTGKLRTDVDPLLLGKDDFSELKNLRYTNTGVCGTSGMTAVNETATSPTSIKNGIHFKKDAPGESHIVLHVTDGDTSTVTIKSTPTIPSVGDDTEFTDLISLSDDGTLDLTEAPDSTLFMMNGVDGLCWSGDEFRCGRYVVHDTEGNFWYDYTEFVTEDRDASDSVAALSHSEGGIDSYTELLLHFDDDLSDSSSTPHADLTTTGGAITYTTGMFDKAAEFNASYLSVADEQCTFDDTTWTVDFWTKFTEYDGAYADRHRPLWMAEKLIYYFNFSGGENEPVRGDVIFGGTSEATAIVEHVKITSGSFTGSDAAGKIYIKDVTGDFVSGEEVTETDATGDVVCDTTSVVASAGRNYIRMWGEVYAGFTGNLVGNLNCEIFNCWSEDYDTVTDTSQGQLLSVNIEASNLTALRHIEICRDAGQVYIFIDGYRKSNTAVSGTFGDWDQFYVGRNNGFELEDGVYTYVSRSLDNAVLDEFRVSDAVVRHNSTFDRPVEAYSASNTSNIYIGSVRPISGINFYVSTANATTSTAVVYYWDGDSWQQVSSQTDGTSTGGVTFAKSGEIAFTSTVATAKPSLIREVLAYYYRIVLTGVDDAAAIYYCTVSVPAQNPIDLWDGVPREPANLLLDIDGKILDKTINVSKQDYDGNYELTYAEIDSFDAVGATKDYIYLGFFNRTQAVYISFPDTTKVNTYEREMYVHYWNGEEWESVGSIDDGTNDDGKPFGQTGIISWQGLAAGTDFETSIDKTLQAHYYRISFSGVISDNIRIDYVYGVPSAEKLTPHKFSVSWANRIWLCNEAGRHTNSALCSASNTSSVFNGDDSVRLYFGDNKELVAGSTLFTRYGSDAYDNMVLFKANEIYMIGGATPSDFRIFQVSNTIGCVAPRTLKKCDMSFAVAENVIKHVLIWESATGIQSFDGSTVSTISEDISDMFDPLKSTYIGTDVADNYGFFDSVRGEYHWLVPSQEIEKVYDVVRKRWWTADRGDDYLVAGFPVIDDNGLQYVYGASSDGFVYRLEYGNKMNATAIDYTMTLADIVLSEQLSRVSELRHLKLLGIEKDTDSALEVRHYGDGKTEGTEIVPMWQKQTGYRMFSQKRSLNLKAVSHRIKFSTTTDNVAIGFEPLAVSGFLKIVRDDTTAD